MLARGRLRSLPCLRLVAPVENRARLGFASLASCVFAQPHRSCRMVSCRAYSSPVPQPASRHIIKPFSIYTTHSQHSMCSRINIAISVCDLGTALRRMSIRFFRRRGSRDLNPVSLRMLAMMMRITYRTRGLRLGATPRPTKVMWQGRGGFSRPVERRKKRRMRPDFDASAFHPVT